MWPGFLRFREPNLAASVPTTEPTEAAAGDTWQWTRTVDDYPASDGWTLSYVIAGASVETVTATTSGSGYAVTVPAGVTARLAPGTYQLIGRVTKAGEVHTIGRATPLLVTPDAFAAEPGDLQSQDEKDYAVIVAAMSGALTGAMSSYTIAGRQVTLYAPHELVALKGQIAARIIKARNGGRLPSVRVAAGINPTRTTGSYLADLLIGGSGGTQ